VNRQTSNIKKDVLSGLSLAAISLPSGISIGLIAFSPLGPEYAYLGALAGILGMIFLTVIPPFTGSSAFQFNGPGPVEAGIFASLLTLLINNPILIQSAAGPDSVITLAVTVMFACVLLSGFFILLIGQLRLGAFVKLIPYPVIAGLINGIVVQILLSQIPQLMGMGKGTGLKDLVLGHAGVNITDVVVGLFTIGSIIAAKRYWKTVPELLTGLTCGTIVYHLLSIPSFNLIPGQTMGSVPSRLPLPNQLKPIINLIHNPEIMELLPDIATVSFTIAIIASLSTLISATMAEEVGGVRHGSVGELTGLGIATIVTALFGGVPGGGTPSRIIVNDTSGGRTVVTHITCACVLLVFISGMGSVVGLIPLSAVAGVLIVISFYMVDRWAILMIRHLTTTHDKGVRNHLIQSLVTILIVFVLVLSADLVTAILAGLVTQLVFFMTNSCDVFIYSTKSGDTFHSRTVRNEAAMNILAQEGSVITVIELQAFLYFGTADHLYRNITESHNKSEYVILDFEHVTDIDSTGALLLKRLDKKLRDEGRVLLMSHISENSEQWQLLNKLGAIDETMKGRIFMETHSALSYAEDSLLRSIAPQLLVDEELPLKSASPFVGFTDDEIQVMRPLLQRRTFKSGERLIADNHESTCLYILVKGRLSITRTIGKNAPEETITLVSFGPGVSIGEMGFLQGKRSANVNVVKDSVCYQLKVSNYEILSKEHPAIALKFISNIACSLARRLIANTDTIVNKSS
jgi:sulfate permease, SulP family